MFQDVWAFLTLILLPSSLSPKFEGMFFYLFKNFQQMGKSFLIEIAFTLVPLDRPLADP